MNASLRSITSPDVDLNDYHSSDPADEGFLLQMFVGPVDAPGEESFDVLVCTPTWMSRLTKKQGPQLGIHYLIVNRVDIGEIREFLRNEVEQIDAPTWGELMKKIGRIGKWEFEDYQP